MPAWSCGSGHRHHLSRNQRLGPALSCAGARHRAEDFSFSHGIPALSTRDGQRCAALADVLLRGLSARRVRRLVSLCAGEGTVLDRLPRDWLGTLPGGSTLHTFDEWKRAFDRPDVERVAGLAELLPLFAWLENGTSASAEVSSALLRGRSLDIWNSATRSAPVQAIELSLQSIRLADDNDAGNSVVWCPAAHLASSPRTGCVCLA